MSSPSKRIVPDGGVDEAQQQPPDRRLAAARLADEPERLAAPDVEAHVVDGLDVGDRPLQDPALHREMLDQVAHLDEGCRARARARHAPPPDGLRRGDGGGCRGGPGPQRARLVVVDPAAHVVAGSNRQQGRVLVERVVDALLDPGQAARGEAAARGQVDQVRHVPGDHRQLLAEVADDRDRPDEAAGIRMQWLAEERHDVGLLDDLAGVHHRDPIAHLGDDAEVVGDQDDRGAGLVAQVAHEVEDLGLDRHVERGRGLVGDQQLRLAGKRHRDHDPLCHPAGHLVRDRPSAAASGRGCRPSAAGRWPGPRRPCPSCHDGCAGPPRSASRRPTPGSATRSAAGRSSRSARRGCGASRPATA